MSMIVNGVEIPKNCAECPAGTYEYNDHDERCFVCGFIKSEHPWECEHREIDGIDTTKTRADFCPFGEVPTPHGRFEPLTDKEQRIFLAAMGRERKVCKEVDDQYTHEPYEVLLTKVCNEIERKVKKALWS